MAVTVYYSRLTVAAGTLRTAPAEATLHCNPGTLVLFRLYVPPGPRGELSLFLRHGESQVAPVPPATWDNLDDDVISYPLALSLPQADADLTLAGYAPNASFSHSVDFEALVDAPDPGLQSVGQASLAQRLLDIFT